MAVNQNKSQTIKTKVKQSRTMLNEQDDGKLQHRFSWRWHAKQPKEKIHSQSPMVETTLQARH